MRLIIENYEKHLHSMDKPILHYDIFLSYYGDDFTGSTDVMESLALNGIPTALFLQAPEKEEILNFRLKAGIGARTGMNRLKAFGVAGIARSWSPEQMDRYLPRIFESIGKIPSDFFQYKICSTFDSSARIGSIGHATDIALRYFPSPFVPLLVGAPFLNRFVVFGNLFARVVDTTYRLDRHPTMSTHPVTPMNESDLRRHLALQSNRTVDLLDIFSLDGAYGSVESIFRRQMDNEDHFLLFDTLTVNHLYTIGQLLIEGKSNRTQLIVGASGADYALAFHLQKLGLIEKPSSLPSVGKAERMVIAAGSCSPTTAAQIEYMESLGHTGIRINSLRLIRPPERELEIKDAFHRAIKALSEGKVPILYTAKGPNDPLVQSTREQLQQNGEESKTGHYLAGAQGRIIKQLIDKLGRLRVVVAGGDTSGYVSRSLEIYALETLCPIAPGAPLCVAHSKDARFDGLQIALKGGQNGIEKYFASILEGRLLE